MPPPFIVYVLGAGFSAPIGIPVVSEFVSRATDLYRELGSDVPHFQRVFDRIDQLAQNRRYFHADPYNIEELLSTIEMDDALGGGSASSDVRAFIADVVTHSTPKPPAPTNSDRKSWTFRNSDTPWGKYVCFVSAILGLPAVRTPNGSATYAQFDYPREATYGVVSLNYDLVLETAAWICGLTADDFVPRFRRGLEATEDLYMPLSAPLAKLHGSADKPGEIVPMTWNKTVRASIDSDWRAAYKMLGAATEIRFLGYSLPESDAYVRHLFKAATNANRWLRRVDVITMDGDGKTEQRFASFVAHRNYRFANRELGEYLSGFHSSYRDIEDGPTRYVGVPTYTERNHHGFMESSKRA